MPELIPRVVFDCNLFVQEISNRNSPARKALRLFFNGDISLFVSEPIIRELREVLNCAELRRKLPGINEPDRQCLSNEAGGKGDSHCERPGGISLRTRPR